MNDWISQGYKGARRKPGGNRKWWVVVGVLWAVVLCLAGAVSLKMFSGDPPQSGRVVSQPSASPSLIEPSGTESENVEPSPTRTTPKPKLTTVKPSPKPEPKPSPKPSPKPEPKPTPSESETPSPSPSPPLDPRFDTCAEANDNGYGPYTIGIDPEYEWYEDRDGDGIVCER